MGSHTTGSTTGRRPRIAESTSHKVMGCRRRAEGRPQNYLRGLRPQTPPSPRENDAVRASSSQANPKEEHRRSVYGGCRHRAKALHSGGLREETDRTIRSLPCIATAHLSSSSPLSSGGPRGVSPARLATAAAPHDPLRRYRRRWNDWLSRALGQVAPHALLTSRHRATLTLMGRAGQSDRSIHQAAAVIPSSLASARERGDITHRPVSHGSELRRWCWRDPVWLILAHAGQAATVSSNGKGFSRHQC